MRRKKVVKIAILLCAAGFFLSETGASLVYATEEDCDSAKAESAQDEVKNTEEETVSSKVSTGDDQKILENDLVSAVENNPVRLQVPEKFDVVMDPWEMDGKGQIYSGEYTIKNISGAKGTLKLTGIAAGTEEDVGVQSDHEDVHTGNGRDLFVEMVVNGEDSLTLLPGGTDYEAILEADEGVTLRFAGEMNENAEDGWHDGDVAITVVYDWVPESEEGPVLTAPLQKEDGVEKEKDIGENTADTVAPEDNSQKEKNRSDTVTLGTDGGKEENIPDTDVSDEEGEKPSDTDMLGGEEGEKGNIPEVDLPDDSKEEEGENPDAKIPGDAGTDGEKNPAPDTPENGERTEDGVLDSDTSEESGAKEEKTPDVDMMKKENTEVEGESEEPDIREEAGNQ